MAYAERCCGQIAPVKLQARGCRSQRRGGKGQHTYDDRRGGKRGKASQQHLQTWMRRGQHQLQPSILFIGGPAVCLGDRKSHQQQRQDVKQD